MNEQAKQEFLRKVDEYDPLKEVPSDLGKSEAVMKTWFRLTFPEGRIVEEIKTLNDKLAIMETQIYPDRQGSEFIANRLGFACRTEGDTSGEFIKRAEREATVLALKDAGFGVVRVQALTKRGRASKADKQIASAGTEEPAGYPAVQSADAQKLPPTESEPPTAPDGESASAATEGEKEEPTSEPAEEPGSIVTEPAMTTGQQGVPAAPIEMPGSQGSMPSVEELLETMSLDEAIATPITFGQDNGKTMGQMARENPQKIGWFRDSYKGPDNRVKAAAILLLMQAGDMAA